MEGTTVSQIPTPTTLAIHECRNHSAQPGMLGLFCPLLPKDLRSQKMKPQSNMLPISFFQGPKGFKTIFK